MIVAQVIVAVFCLAGWLGGALYLTGLVMAKAGRLGWTIGGVARRRQQEVTRGRRAVRDSDSVAL